MGKGDVVAEMTWQERWVIQGGGMDMVLGM